MPAFFLPGLRRLSLFSALLACALVLTLLPGVAPPASAATCAAKPTSQDRTRLRRMKPSHPRLLASATRMERTAAWTESHSWAAQAREDLLRQANRHARRATPAIPLSGGRLQFQAYRNRLLILALAWRLEGDPDHLAAAQADMLAAARMSSWNPAHYLDTAEIAAVTAVGYDWTFKALDPAARAEIESAILNKGLRPSLCFYRRGYGPVVQHSNWGIVTNAGMAMAAMAVGERYPRVSAAVLGGALRNVRPALRQFGPDGSYPEGTWYWRYATDHMVKMISSLQTAFGRDFNLLGINGVRRTGNYLLHSTAPTGKMANFSNAYEHVPNIPQLYWLAGRTGRGIDAWQARRHAKITTSPLYLLWFTPEAQGPVASGIDRRHVSKSNGTAFLRGRWKGSRTGYVALKGGSNAAPHAHRELGSFVYEALGQRWVSALGPDNFALPGYFNPTYNTRYYRVATRGQNTLTVAGEEQPATASAGYSRVDVSGRRARAVLNLTAAYPKATSLQRGVSLLRRRNLLVQDEIVAKRRRDVVWTVHTTAAVTIKPGGRTAVLSQGGERVRVRMLRPVTDATFSVESAYQPPPQASNTGVTRLVIRTRTKPRPTEEVTTKSGETKIKRVGPSRLRLAVVLRPVVGGKVAKAPRVRPLARW